jgi:hypothetical protein
MIMRNHCRKGQGFLNGYRRQFTVETRHINPQPYHPMRPEHLIRILPLCAVLLFTGCSGNEPEQPQTGSEQTSVQKQVSKTIEPCELVPGEEAAKILGEAVKPAEKSEQQIVGMKLCLYRPVAESSGQFLQVTLTQDSFMPPQGIASASIYRSLKDDFECTRNDIEGVGDEAFISTGGIYILTGKYYIQIGAGNTDKDSVRNQLIEAGKIAVAKLETLQ